MNPVQSVLSRIGSDFFSLMVPGCYLLVCLAIMILSAYPTIDPFWLIAEANTKLMTQWPSVLAMVLFSYLLGQVVHAFPVNTADEYCGRCFRWTAVRTWHKLLYKSNFPYQDVLQETLVQVRDTRPAIPGDVLPSSPRFLHSSYNYWKLAVCQDNPNVFALAQLREARVRLYGGMFLSGAAGTVMGLLSLCGAWILDREDRWFHLIHAQLIVSAVVLLTFGYHLRRMRNQEVETIFVGYLLLLEKQANNIATGLEQASNEERLR